MCVWGGGGGAPAKCRVGNNTCPLTQASVKTSWLNTGLRLFVAFIKDTRLMVSASKMKFPSLHSHSYLSQWPKSCFHSDKKRYFTPSHCIWLPRNVQKGLSDSHCHSFDYFPVTFASMPFLVHFVCLLYSLLFSKTKKQIWLVEILSSLKTVCRPIKADHVKVIHVLFMKYPLKGGFNCSEIAATLTERPYSISVYIG